MEFVICTPALKPIIAASFNKMYLVVASETLETADFFRVGFREA